MKRWHALAACAAALLALLWLRADRDPSPRRRSAPRVEAPAAEAPAPQAAPPASAPEPARMETAAVPAEPHVVPAASDPAGATRPKGTEGDDGTEAWARKVTAELTDEERLVVDRHLTRFVRAPSGGPEAPAAGLTLLPKADPDGAEQRRIEQLELLRRRKAVALLDHIGAGLAWLALHQGPDGKISDTAAAACCAELGHEPACTFAWADDRFAAPVTALAVVALLDFRDQDKQGVFEPTLARAVAWLRARQQENGAFPGRAHYATAISLLALGQAASSSGNVELRESVRLGLSHLASQVGPDGGYRYTARQPGDLSVTAWVAQAVEAARHAGVEIPARMEEGMRRFLDDVWLGEHRFAYTVGQREQPSLAPAGMLMALIGRDVPCPHGAWNCAGEAVEKSWRPWFTKPPEQLYSLYYGLRVASLLEEDLSDSWRAAIVGLAATQEREGAAAGAFRRVRMQGAGGPALLTAFATLTLEHVLYRR